MDQDIDIQDNTEQELPCLNPKKDYDIMDIGLPDKVVNKLIKAGFSRASELIGFVTSGAYNYQKFRGLGDGAIKILRYCLFRCGLTNDKMAIELPGILDHVDDIQRFIVKWNLNELKGEMSLSEIIKRSNKTVEKAINSLCEVTGIVSLRQLTSFSSMEIRRLIPGKIYYTAIFALMRVNGLNFNVDDPLALGHLFSIAFYSQNLFGSDLLKRVFADLRSFISRKDIPEGLLTIQELSMLDELSSSFINRQDVKEQ